MGSVHFSPFLLRNMLETFKVEFGKNLRNIQAEAKKCVSYKEKMCMECRLLLDIIYISSQYVVCLITV